MTLLALPGGASAGLLSAPGPNPNWTEMQKFEWYLGYMAKATQTCGAYEESGRLHALARMTPYGNIGLGAVTGDGFSGPVCGRITNDAKELVADEKQIREYIEATYKCRGEACHGRTLADDWRSHTCGEVLAGYLSRNGVEENRLREVGISKVINSGNKLDYQVRMRLNGCEGSLYVELSDSCRIKKDYIRGGCSMEEVKASPCQGEDCDRKPLASGWQSHTCGEVLAGHLSSYGIRAEDVRAVGFTNVRHSGATLDYQARVRLKHCQGSLYVDLNEHCRVEKDYTRGDCTIEGVKGF